MPLNTRNKTEHFDIHEAEFQNENKKYPVKGNA